MLSLVLLRNVFVRLKFECLISCDKWCRMSVLIFLSSFDLSCDVVCVDWIVWLW